MSMTVGKVTGLWCKVPDIRCEVAGSCYEVPGLKRKVTE